MGAKSFTTASVTSRDGTRIGYRQIGEGPGAVIVHGGVQSSYDYAELGEALSDQFTVYIPDRRGRGLSGPVGENYGIEKEREDITALVEETDARYSFGLSSGAVIALEAAKNSPDIERVAAYEPPLFTERINPIDWGERFEQEIAQGKLGRAFITLFDEAVGLPRPLRLVPRFLLAPLVGGTLKMYDRLGRTERIPITELLPTQVNDIRMIRSARPTPEGYSDLSAEVLLLGGSKSPQFLRTILDELEAALPHATRIEFDGIGHSGPSNLGEPERIAQKLRHFFSS